MIPMEIIATIRDFPTSSACRQTAWWRRRRPRSSTGHPRPRRAAGRDFSHLWLIKVLRGRAGQVVSPRCGPGTWGRCPVFANSTLQPIGLPCGWRHRKSRAGLRAGGLGAI